MQSKSNFTNFRNLIQSLTATLQTLNILVVCISQRVNIDRTNVGFLKKNYDDLKIQSLVFSAWNHKFYGKKITLPSLKLLLFEIITFHNILFQFLTSFQRKRKNINNYNFMEKYIEKTHHSG